MRLSLVAASLLMAQLSLTNSLSLSWQISHKHQDFPRVWPQSLLAVTGNLSAVAQKAEEHHREQRGRGACPPLDLGKAPTAALQEHKEVPSVLMFSRI